MLLSDGIIGSAGLREKKRNPAANAQITALVVAVATIGLRFDQRQTCAGRKTGRAMIGRPSSQRSRSSASSPAEQ